MKYKHEAITFEESKNYNKVIKHKLFYKVFKNKLYKQSIKTAKKLVENGLRRDWYERDLLWSSFITIEQKYGKGDFRTKVAKIKYDNYRFF